MRHEFSGEIGENKIIIWKYNVMTGFIHPICIVKFKNNEIKSIEGKMNIFGKTILYIVFAIIIGFYIYTFLNIKHIEFLIPWLICSLLFLAIILFYRWSYIRERDDLTELIKELTYTI